MLVGLTALSLETKINFSTSKSFARLATLHVPTIFVLTASCAEYSLMAHVYKLQHERLN